MKFIIMRRNVIQFVLFLIFFGILSCSTSNDDLTRILLINWISITIYGSVVKVPRNRGKRCMHTHTLNSSTASSSSLVTEWRVRAKKRSVGAAAAVFEYRFLLHNVIIYEKSSVKNCMCHKSSCSKHYGMPWICKPSVEMDANTFLSIFDRDKKNEFKPKEDIQPLQWRKCRWLIS